MDRTHGNVIEIITVLKKITTCKERSGIRHFFNHRKRENILNYLVQLINAIEA